MKNSPASVVLFNDTTTSRHFGCDAVGSTLNEFLDTGASSVIKRYPLGYAWQDDKYVESVIESANVVIVNGEGSIHHGSTRARQLAAIGPMCRALDRPCCLINATIQGNGETVFRDLAEFTGIWVRESRSQLDLMSAGIRAEVCPDLSFWQELGQWHPETHKVAFIDSVDKRINQKLEWAAATHGTRLLSMKRSEAGEALYYPMRSRLARVLSRYPQPAATAGAVRSYRGFAEFLARKRGLVTGRFHGLCFGLNMGIPLAVVPSNTWKSEGLVDDVGLSSSRLLFEQGSVSPQPWSEEELDSLARYRESARVRIAAMFKQILNGAIKDQ